MTVLYSFGPNFGLVDPSPFVVKVDAFMRMANIPFEVKIGIKHTKKSDKRKLPIIEDDGQIIPDSQFIIEYLTKKYQITLDDFLTAEQKAQAYLFTKSLDENLYWPMVYSRWVDEQTWPTAKEAFFGKLPLPLKLFLPTIIQKGVKKNLYGQGTGRHSKSEILDIAKASLGALSTLLGDKPYFFGDKISSFDATAYGFLSEFILVNYDNDFNLCARSFDNLVSYCHRIQQAYYP